MPNSEAEIVAVIALLRTHQNTETRTITKHCSCGWMGAGYLGHLREVIDETPIQISSSRTKLDVDEIKGQMDELIKLVKHKFADKLVKTFDDAATRTDELAKTDDPVTKMTKTTEAATIRILSAFITERVDEL